MDHRDSKEIRMLKRWDPESVGFGWDRVGQNVLDMLGKCSLQKPISKTIIHREDCWNLAYEVGGGVKRAFLAIGHLKRPLS